MHITRHLIVCALKVQALDVWGQNLILRKVLPQCNLKKRMKENQNVDVVRYLFVGSQGSSIAYGFTP